MGLCLYMGAMLIYVAESIYGGYAYILGYVHIWGLCLYMWLSLYMGVMFIYGSMSIYEGYAYIWVLCLYMGLYMRNMHIYWVCLKMGAMLIWGLDIALVLADQLSVCT